MPHKYGQTALYVVLLIIIVAGMTMTRRCSHQSSLPTLIKGGSGGDTIDVAILYGPSSYYLYSDTLGGINYDMLRLFASQTSTPLKIWPVVNLHDALSRLENGSYTILASLPSDNSVKERFLTTQNVFLDKMVLVQTIDSTGQRRINSILDLAGDTVHIQRDSPAIMRLRRLSKEIGSDINLALEEGMSEEYLCMAVATGKMKQAVVNERIARRMQKQYPNLNFEKPVSFTQFQVWLFSPEDSVLFNKTEQWLTDFKSTPDYRRLIGKY